MLLKNAARPYKTTNRSSCYGWRPAYQVAVKRELPAAMVYLDRFHLYRDINHKVRSTFKEIARSEAGQVQRQIIRLIANFTSQDGPEAEAFGRTLSRPSTQRTR